MRDDAGLYEACLAIRSGRGSMTHHRVMRFVPRFDSHDQALGFAHAQADAWVSEHDLPRITLDRS